MRLHRLEVEGFGPFLERQVVDFDGFSDDGIFLIAGRTGAGKSSILDAVCFGLYGSVPRYESGDKRLRSDHCAPDDASEVVVEFSTTAGRYRVARSPEYMRPAKRGGGLTKQQPTVALDELVDGEWIGRAARAVDVAGELEEILQLSREQFLQVILLAQNRFARFLLADSKERQSLLRRLFGTERFEDVQARFDERRRAAEHALSGRLAAVDARLEEAERVTTAADLWGEHEHDDHTVAAGADTAAERLAALRLASARAAYQAERGAAEAERTEGLLAAADAALAARRDERKAQQERDASRAALAALDEQEPEITAARTALAQARAAEALRAVLVATRRADEAQRTATDAEDAARAEWEQVGVELAETDPAALTTWAAERTKESGAWERAAEAEQGLDALESAVASAEQEATSAAAALAALDAEHGELPERITTLTARRDEVRRAADRVDELARALESATARRTAAETGERLHDELAAAERALLAANEQLTAAQAAVTELRRRRLDGMAGEIASELVDGEPCAVCGSTAHPAPAAHSDPVTVDDIEAAEQVRTAATTAEATAAERVSTLKAELAAADARADGRTVDTARHEETAAQSAVAEARTTASALAEAEEALVTAQTRAAALDAERTAATTLLATARESVALSAQRAQDARTLIADARGDFDSVAARIEAVAAQAAAARRLAEAGLARQRAVQQAADARQEQDAALAATDFDDATAVQAALRSAAEQTEIDARITAHTVHREKERETLLALELRVLPEEAVDVSAAEEAAAAARALWKHEFDAAGRARTTAERLDELIAAADDEHARSATQQAEFETLRSLADTIAGRGANTRKMTLETFVLAAELEEIVDAANRRLDDMSTGRYRLQHSDALAARGAASGLGIVVFDAFTGQTRPAQSLSGGETFLSSLALALGLAEVVTSRAGGIQLDTLFIDEGFGSLDADTLEIAMRTLDELRSGGRTVGVISHVESMQEQIPAQLRVEQTETGPSRIITR